MLARCLALAALLIPSVALAQAPPAPPPPGTGSGAPAAPANPYPQGQYPQGQYPQGQYPQGQYPQGQYPQGQYPTNGGTTVDPNTYQPLPNNAANTPPPNATTYTYPHQPAGQAEMIVDFGTVGLLTGITIDLRGVNDSSLGTMVVVGSTAGGGAVGWLLADRFDATRGDAYMTTLGLLVGASNGALLLSPLHDTHSGEQVMGVLTLSSAIGTGAGFLASRGEKLTPGQGLFATNVTLLGVGSAALIASITDHDGNHDDAALTALAIGLDGGVIVGLAVAPHINWSHRRASVVGMGTLAGTLVGGMVAGLVAPKQTNTDGTSSLSQNFVATSVLIGAWAGFGAGILETSDLPPDPTFGLDAGKQPKTPPVSIAPMLRPEGGGGVAVSGIF